jgi:hypothetical protein
MRLVPWALATLVALGIATTDLSAGDDGPRSRGSKSGYYWRPVSGSNKQELFIGLHKIGVYDPDTDTYQRVAADGSLSRPVSPPWKTGLSQKPASSEPKAPAPAGAVPEPPAFPEASAEEPAAAPAAEEKPFLPTWLISAVVSGVISFAGFTLAGKRWPPQTPQTPA